MQPKDIEKAADIIAGPAKAMALTGAGISVESGIPSFRGADGLWTKWDPRMFDINYFQDDPARGWVLLKELRQIIDQAEPNAGHKALAELEDMGVLTGIVTQNVDGLHQAGGSRTVVEFHGNGRLLRCLRCHRQCSRQEVSWDSLPPRCSCGGVLKPDVVFFGEAIPTDASHAAFDMAANCRSMLVVGTSAMVAPASHLPHVAKRAGATIIEINPEPTPLSTSLSDLVLAGPAGEILPALASAVRARTAH